MNVGKRSQGGRLGRVLIVKMWALGDILLATPLLHALKRHDPGCEIVWFVEKAQAPILEDNPLIDEVIGFDSAAWRRQFRYGRIGPYLQTSTTMRRDLRARRFDVVINLTAEKWWSVWFTVAPIRIGLFPRARAGAIAALYTDAIGRSRDPLLHNTQHYLLPAKVLGIPGPYDERMVLGVSDAHRADVARFLAGQSDFRPSRPTLILHPGTSQVSKCWPAERYAAVARALTEYNVVVTGSPGERVLADEVASGSGRSAIVAAGELGHIGQTAALIERSAVVVSGDTSILHMASALDVPLVGIYGSTRPGDNTPLFGRSELVYDDSVPCAPCYRAKCPLSGQDHMRCMSGISVEQVTAAIGRLGVWPDAESLLPRP